MRKSFIRSLSLSLFSVLVLGLLALPVSAAGEAASGQLIDGSGAVVGTVNLSQNAAGAVQLTVTFNKIPAGQHGIHFHAIGKCEGPSFTTAGDHFNPEGKKHGLNNPDGPHAGDLPVLTSPAGGNGSYTATTSTITLSAGAKQLTDADGAALVIHANPDDQTTDPSGNSGGRIACAVLTLSASNLPSAPASGAGGISQPGNNALWWLLGVLGLMIGSASLILKKRSARQ